MKKIVAILALSSLAGCQGSNEHGECVGFGKQDATKTYELSTRNAVWTAVFVESLWAPAAWALEYAYCPTGDKR